MIRIFKVMRKYIIAVKRGKEELVKKEWTELTEKISNMELISNYRNKRIVISTDEDGLIHIENELSSDNFHIEPLIERKRSTNLEFIKKKNTIEIDDESE